MKTFLFVFALMIQATAWPCTVFQMAGPKPVVGKTFDWWVEHGMVAVNLRGLEKSALLLDPSTAIPLTWQSLYGSVTINQVSREFPFGGMNEKGLVVEVLWLDDSEYPDLNKGTPSINEAQWIQFILDTSATTTEALAQLNSIQIQMGFAPVHYMICDAMNDCATVEFIAQKQVIHHGSTLPYPILANHSYDDHSLYLADFLGFGGSKPVQKSMASLDRFVVAADRVKATSPAQVDTKRASAIIDDVQADNTVWKLIYQDQKILFSTQKHSSQRELDMSLIDFSCKTGQPLHLDLQKDIADRAANSHLTPITATQNRAYLKKSVYLPAPILTMIDNFASTGFPCGL